MAMAETAHLIVQLGLKDGLTGGLRTAQSRLAGMEGSAKRTQGALSKVGAGFRFGAGFFLAERALRGIPGLITDAIASLDELENVEAQTGAAIVSTGGAAGLTAKQIRDLSVSLEDQTTIDDKLIQKGANLLLTFTDIQNRAGEGNDIFNQATSAVLDLSTAMGGDVKGAALQLGKALNDPIGGLVALKRVGVQFDDEQKKQIKTFVEAGDILGAQKVILAEVNQEMGGRAVATGKTYAGNVRRLGDAFEELQLAGVKAALPGLTKLVATLATTFRDPAFLQGAQDIGKAIGDLFTKENFDGIKDFVSTTLPPLVEGLKLAGQATKTIVDLFRSLPPELQKAVVLGVVANKISGGLVGSAIGGVVKGGVGGVLSAVRGATRATPVYVQDVGVGAAGAGAGGKGGKGGGAANTVLGILGAVSVAAVANEVYPLVAQTARDIHKELGLDKTALAGIGSAVGQLEWPFGPRNTPILDIGPFKDILGGSHQSVPMPGVPFASWAEQQAAMWGGGTRPGSTPSTIPGAPARGTNIGGGMLPGAPGRPKVKPLPGVTPPRSNVGRGDPVNRQPINVNISTDHRQNSSAAAITNRYGPTPAEAGSR